MDRQNANFFNLYDGNNSLSTPNPNLNSISPYLNFDPNIINQGGPEFIFPEGAARQRGRFELAFSQIGGSVLAGAFLGSVNGLYTGLKETSIAGHTGSVRRTQVLNFITKRGSVFANALGVVALMYSGIGVMLSLARNTDDEYNTVTAATLTGLLYKGTAGIKKCVHGGAVGCGLGVAYVLWMSRSRLRGMLPSSNY